MDSKSKNRSLQRKKTNKSVFAKNQKREICKNIRLNNKLYIFHIISKATNNFNPVYIHDYILINEKIIMLISHYYFFQYYLKKEEFY